MANLKAYISYNPETGDFFWKKAYCKKVVIGKRAGNVGPNGYRRISIKNTFYQAHRLAWFLMTGKWPQQDIDHINGNRSDNRWCNIRAVSRSLNLHNKNARGFQKNHKGYMARIQINKRCIYLGTYRTSEEAKAAYLRAKKTYRLGGRYG